MGKIVKVILIHRKAYCYVLPIVMVVTYLLMCCMPRYYMSSVVLAPESSDNTSLGSFSSSLASLGLGSLGKLANNDAISPDLYPDLLSSNDFVVQLFPIKVINKDGSINTNYYDYLNHKQKDAWWNKIKGYIMELIDPTPLTNFKGTEKVDIFSMSKKQQDIAAKIKKNINCEIDQKTYAITISVKDQDPKICATIADSTRQHLQNFIIDYRTNKAKNDYAYYNNLCNKAKKEYDAVSNALKMVKLTGYGFASASLDDIELSQPEIIKQGNRYGVKLKAVAPSIHMIKVDVESSFEPIIGSKLQSEELISYLTRDSENSQTIWESDIFGRKLSDLIKDGLNVKLSMIPETARVRLQDILTKLVNKGKGNVIAIVL